jgi:DNA-binding MarR family transcriptional regulator
MSPHQNYLAAEDIADRRWPKGDAVCSLIGEKPREVSVLNCLEGPVRTDLQFNVRTARKLRDLRRRLLGGGLDTGPAWDLLLHLFESHVLQRRDVLGDVTNGAELPAATAGRWIRRLEQEGLIRSRDDHLDGRRRFVELTARGIELMTRYFSGAAPHLIAA